MDGFMQGYDDIASSFAAEWYDFRASSSGFKLKRAVTMAVYSPIETDKVARYQAKKLAKGNDAAFAKSCGEYARNDVLRSLNETIIENAHRDRKRGVRFARVTTGNETCLFCLMLASRGAVYKTRKTAGEFKSFHRGCDCKVVPGFEKDPLAELVEGHNPKAEYRKWKRFESAEEVDSGLYAMTTDKIAMEASELDKAIKPLFRKAKKSRDYAGVFEAYLAEHAKRGTITGQYWARPEGKELQLASWLAEKGHDVEFLRPSADPGSRTPDVRIDGDLWEIKRITTTNCTKAKSRVGDALNQSENVIVDLSVNENAKEIEMAVIEVLDDRRASNLLVIRDGKSIRYTK